MNSGGFSVKTGCLGIMSAMQEELDLLVRELKIDRTEKRGGREYHRGLLWGHEAVLVQSRYGKVAAATTATELISHYGIGRMIFTGVAGGLHPDLRVGDVVVGTSLVQHDMDARPIFPRHEIPLLGITEFATDRNLSAELVSAARALPGTQVLSGWIASGDQFIADSARVKELRTRLPEVLCVEMEGAAVAQVCHEYGLPFGIVRTISDAANEDAPVDFRKFVVEVASRFSLEILRNFLHKEGGSTTQVET